MCKVTVRPITKSNEYPIFSTFPIRTDTNEGQCPCLFLCADGRAEHGDSHRLPLMVADAVSEKHRPCAWRNVSCRHSYFSFL